MKHCKEANAYRRMEAAALLGEGKTMRKSTVDPLSSGLGGKLVSRFCNEGIDALPEDGRQGGTHQNLTAEEEEKLLKEFEQAAGAGQLITPAEIKKGALCSRSAFLIIKCAVSSRDQKPARFYVIAGM